MAPIEYVPDYEAWYRYGGNQHDHTYRQVPKDLLVPLPRYTRTAAASHGSIYSVSYMGTYHGDDEGSGSHPGVDIRVPVGTPVRSIANGVVSEVKTGGGFGNVVVIRHPNVPDPDNPNRTTTLYSSYAHLDSVLVEPGLVVTKGEQIATSGKTGYASGPHLHFQIDKESAPWHPYWPFTTAEQNGMSLSDAVNTGLHKSRGFQFTVSPLVYVQADYRAATVAEQPREEVIQDPTERLLSSVERRRLERLRNSPSIVSTYTPPARPETHTDRLERTRADRQQERLEREAIVEQHAAAPAVVSRQEVVSRDIGAGLSAEPVHDVRVVHDGRFSGRGWESITIQLVDKDQNVIVNPKLEKDLFLRTAFGNAEFRPSKLTLSDFRNGEVLVHMLPRGRRTVVIQVWPFHSTSDPMEYEE